MKYLNTFENYLTKKYQRKNKYDEYLYDNGFGDRYYICSQCGSHKLTPTPSGGFSSPKWNCDTCGAINLSPSWVSPDDYWLKHDTKKYNL